MIDDQMQAGYNLLEVGKAAKACELWLAVWKNLLDIVNAQRYKSLDEFDEAFAGSQAIFNWVQDLEMELWNTGLHDHRLLHERARFCEEFLSRFPHEDGQLSENMKRAWAESCFSIGETIKVEALFQQWLDEDPSWGWGWIGWSDCYRYLDKNNQDLDKAEKILRDGLSVKGVRDKKEIQNRLAALYAESGKELKLSESHGQLAGRKNVKLETTINASGNVLRLKRKIDFGEEGLPVEELGNLYDALQADFPDSPVTNKKNSKIGRNELCPCGSGKKFKRCCGK
jgi:tetratricopeptide (TPR) repeat protein